ncbi:FAD-dependent oxidoreductase [Gelidibacter japonicus]|uniref:NAD(P)/FAD-dependent oxidoreductase n=1 Tax=Gelidibacter japonicus TaxID=1962232 RepID=UPI0020201894|nr:FAD-dependent oxidoreductase [Gelidibacter japonicus]MCL8007154.1 FAD-dependent oxidoreductase [Gelidibacter japonicus]
MNKSVIVIGGGIIGLCSSYYLQKEGHQVTIIDQSNMDVGASYVNAGFVSPSHIIPLSAPGVMKKGLKWMFNPASPLYIKPRLDPDFLKWTYAFNKSCTADHVKKAIPSIKDLTLLSQELYNDIKANEHFTFQYKKEGLLMLCQTQKALEEEMENAEMAINEGLDVQEVTLEDLKQLEPNVNLNVIGGTYYRSDSHSTPSEFMTEMKTYLKSKGVVFHPNEKVEDLELKDRKITALITKNQKLKADEFVLAAGSWSALLSKKVGIHLLLQAGKGYRINTTKPTGIKLPAILMESKVAVTPMNGFTRFAGTMEIGGINDKINKTRVNAIANAVTKYYPEIALSEIEKDDVASGLRPVSPDGLAYIGRSSKCSNLTIATGHAMLGWSMGTGTGKLVSELISEKSPSLNLDMFNPDRRF